MIVDDRLNAVVAQRIEVAPGLMVLRVAPDGWELPEFTAGQFAVLGLPVEAPRFPFSDEETEPPKADGLIKRAYSIASSSVVREYLEFYIVLVRSGSLTPRLFALGPGDRVWLGPKCTGMFTIDQVPEGKHVVFVGTGTGIAPYMSMLRTHMVCGGERHFGVLHGARHSWDLGYRSELRTLDYMCGNFSYIPCISRPQEEVVPWGGQSGYIQELWKRQPLEDTWGFHPTADNSHVFICGNPEMAKSMLDLLAEEGFQEHSKQNPGNVHVEKYW